MNLTESLINWYNENKRKLPWREIATPYGVWLSEIMLQQTRVLAVIPYYHRFVEAFPSIQTLANADENRLMKLWEGLGYYSRCRNLQKCAKTLVAEYNGELPADYDKLLKLPGIGPYTAGAIASIAFGLPQTAVDGNVLRVFSRLLQCEGDISQGAVKKEITKEVEKYLPVDFPGDFNQAVMELGALVCLPNAQPKCNICPLNTMCFAHLAGVATNYPVKSAKKQRSLEYKNVFFIAYQDGFLLKKRQNKGLLAGLWELPNAEKTEEETIFSQLLNWNIIGANVEDMGKAKHIFTHKEWHMDGYYVEAQPPSTLADGFQLVKPEEFLENFALPSAFRQYFTEGLFRMEGKNKSKKVR